jgi:RNA polymerase sigma factor (TIGR02999 family)
LEAAEGSAAASEQLYGLLYEELRRMAGRHLRRERKDHTLQPTELVNEAYLRLVDQTRCQWKNRTHFLAIASRAMRRILVDHARDRVCLKRGGGWKKVPLDEALGVGTADDPARILTLDIALGKLAAREPDKARVVEMHFFGGLTHEECAQVLGVSSRTVIRHWEYAQAWLYREMIAGPGPA